MRPPKASNAEGKFAYEPAACDALSTPALVKNDAGNTERWGLRPTASGGGRSAERDERKNRLVQIMDDLVVQRRQVATVGVMRQRGMVAHGFGHVRTGPVQV